MLDGVIVIAALILNPRARKREREAKRAALDSIVAQAKATRPLLPKPTIVEEVGDRRQKSEKELGGNSQTEIYILRL